ncbi:hypothetical protein GIB67_022462, partial [Kingdonia uniflora]
SAINIQIKKKDHEDGIKSLIAHSEVQECDVAAPSRSDCPSSSKDSRREFFKDKRLQIASDDDKNINGEDDRCAHHADEDKNYQNVQEKLVDEDGESFEEEGEFYPDKHMDRPLDFHDNPDSGKYILSHLPFVEKGNSDRHRNLKRRRSVFDDEGSSDEDSEIVKEDQIDEYKKLEVLALEIETTIASLEEDLAKTHKEKEEILLRNKLLTNALLELVEEKEIWVAKEKASFKFITEKVQISKSELSLFSNDISEVKHELESSREGCKAIRERLEFSEEKAEYESKCRWGIQMAAIISDFGHGMALSSVLICVFKATII